MNIKDLVTTGFKLDKEIKEKQKILNEIKTEMKKLSEESGLKEFKGVNCFVSITDRPETKCNPKEYWKYCTKNGLEKEFFQSISVAIKDARELVGETEFKKISSSMTTQQVVSFKSTKITRRIKK